MASLLHIFQNRFSYRQRFIFFALVYFVGMPPQSFWVIQTQNHLLEMNALQRRGAKVQESFGSLLKMILEHKVLSVSQSEIFLKSSQSIKEVEEAIEEEFKRLQSFQDQEINVSPKPLSLSFSNLPTPQYSLDELQKNWKELLRESGKKRTTRYRILIDKIQENIQNFGFSFGLFLTTDPIVYSLVELNLKMLPEGEVLVGELVSSEFKPSFFEDLIYSLKQRLISYPIHLEALHESRKNISSVPYTRFIELEQSKILLKGELEEFLYLIKKLNSKKETPILSPFSFFSYKSSVPLFSLKRKPMVNSEDIQKLALQILETNQEVRQISSLILKEVLQDKWNLLFYQKWTGLCLLFICTLFILLIVISRFFTKHFEKLKKHVDNLAKGKFVKCFCSDSQDDFGLVGRALDKVSKRMKAVVMELQRLKQLLADFTGQIKKAAFEQGETLTEQEIILKQIEKISKEIIGKSSLLAQTMDELNKVAKATNLDETAHIKLEKMQEKMTNLKQASSTIIDKICLVQEKVKQTSHLIDLMISVSEETKVLALNAAIETSNVDHARVAFLEITQHIERFSDLTAVSTNRIKEIIHEMSASVVETKLEASSCLKEISEGASRLVGVSYQLSGITRRREEQVKKFEDVNIAMQSQALAGKTMLDSIAVLGEFSKKNSNYLKNLHETIKEIKETAVTLQNVLDRFQE